MNLRRPGPPKARRGDLTTCPTGLAGQFETFPLTTDPTSSPSVDLVHLLEAQRAAYRREGAPSLADRRADLSKMRAALIDNRSLIEAAINTDFGHRSRHETSIMELAGLIGGIDYLRKHLPRMMRPEKRCRDSHAHRFGTGGVSAARRRRRHGAVELPGRARTDARGDRDGGRQPRDAEAVGVHPDDLPFGGVGAGGIGAYHGIEGFRRLSHAKGIFTQGRWNSATLLRAPFGKMAERILSVVLR